MIFDFMDFFTFVAARFQNFIYKGEHKCFQRKFFLFEQVLKYYLEHFFLYIYLMNAQLLLLHLTSS